MNKYLIIFNVCAGKRRALKHKEQIVDFFNKNDLSYLIEYTHKQNDASLIANKYCLSDYNYYVICGGDGTVNEVVNGLETNHEKTLIFIPLGTVNIFAKENKIPKNIKSSLKLILNGSIKEITVGMCKNKKFLLMQSVGIDSYVVQHVTQKLKMKFGLFAYVFIFFKSIFTYGYPPMLIKDGKTTYSGVYILISKCKYYGGFLRITPDARLEDDTFTISILTKKGLLILIKFIILSFLGLNHLNKNCMYFKSNNIKIYGAELYSQIDGELGPQLPLRIYIDIKKIKCLT